MCELVQTITAPVTCLRTLKTHREQQADLARRKRNRVLLCEVLFFAAVIAVIVIVQLLGR